MRPVDEILRLLATGGQTTAPESIPVTDVTVGPLSAAGPTEPVASVETPSLGLYHARARGLHLVIDTDEFEALRAAGAAYDDGVFD